jgi:hypothetical protein
VQEFNHTGIGGNKISVVNHDRNPHPRSQKAFNRQDRKGNAKFARKAF